MNYEIVKLKEKMVVGLSGKTKNSNPDMEKVIGTLWHDFYQNGVYVKIKNKSNEKALGLYTDYESDWNGEYSAVVACEVEKAEEIPEEAVIKIIPEGKYAKFIVRGHMQQAVASFWEELWQMNLNRAYTCDFEEYQDGNVEDATIHIYIAIK